MQRVSSKALHRNEHAVWCYGTQPYSGLVYVLSPDGVVTSVVEFDQGAEKGSRRDLQLVETAQHVDSSALTTLQDYGPELFQGTPFQGVVCSFDETNCCVLEEVFANGYSTEESRRGWYPSGAPRFVATQEQSTVWTETGIIASVRRNDQTLFNVALDNQGCVRLICFRRNENDSFRQELISAWEQLLVVSSFASKLNLLGDESLRCLADLAHTNAKLDATDTIALRDLSLTVEWLSVLQALPSLKTLVLSANTGATEELLQPFRSVRPDVVVELQKPFVPTFSD